eukprot:TRINITY_DN22381_c0_g4_i1.p1 TRINITY_DN22381_c0_g4~~TRINITY_DN22381_c0_g4_i1.p1  ORF type:complete len:787 (+),score=149.03 TRINITY_DN22381_c0_g4_i1:214-2574(+)
MAESVVVGVRVRPFNDREKALKATLCIDMVGPKTIITDPAAAPGIAPLEFSFDASFWSHDGFDVGPDGYASAQAGGRYADQRLVYDTFGQRVLDNAWMGFHCCLFAYGQTGAGKSYSMVGYGANKGIVPVSCQEIFKRIGEGTTESKRFEVCCSMIEIYNETVQDLLIDPEDRPRKGLDIRESKLLGVYVDGVVKRPVQSYAQIEETIDEATDHRTVGSTLMNATSSRAHTVVMIDFKQVEKIGGKDSSKVSTINLVDLAGSEKAGQTKADGLRLKEGAMINKSLTALGIVIEKLAAASTNKKGVVVPYRDSKLTRLLQNALGGSSKTIMVCALSPASSNYEETLSTLRYADRAKKIKNNATVNENPQDRLIRQLQEDNAALKAMLEDMKIGKNIDFTMLKAKTDEIHDHEEALKNMSRTFEERVNVEEGRRLQRQATTGISLESKLPQLVNLNEDMQLMGRIRHELQDGKTTKLGQHGGVRIEDDGAARCSQIPATRERRATFQGSIKGLKAMSLPLDATDIAAATQDQSKGNSAADDSDTEDDNDIMLVGVGIYASHCKIVNNGGVCKLVPAHSHAARNTFVNGVSLAKHKDAHDEDGRALSCPCGNVYIDDAAYCRKCGLKRPAVAVEAGSGVPDTAKADEGVKLEHGDCVGFGRSTLFVFVDPSKGSAKALLGTVSYSAAAAALEKAQADVVRDATLGGDQEETLQALESEVTELRAMVSSRDQELWDLRAEVLQLRTGVRVTRGELEDARSMLVAAVSTLRRFAGAATDAPSGNTTGTGAS